MTEELDDSANAVPASTAAALEATPRPGRDDRGYVSAPAFPRTLSPAARAAVARADDFRAKRERGGIDVEHLVVGLYGDPDGAARRAFDAAGVDDMEIARRLKNAGLDAPHLVSVPRGDPTRERFAGTALEPVPRLTQAVLDVLLDAERRASTGPTTAGITDVPHLLRALAAGAHPAARLFADVWARLDDDEPLVVRELAAAELDALVGSLSVSSRKALGVADALRGERRSDAVHMEHLLVGLQVDQGGHQWDVLDAAGLQATALAERLTRFELRLDTAPSDGAARTRLAAPSGEAVTRMPPLSPHATLALSAAAALAGWQPGTTPTPGAIQARHLLAGWFAVRECSVVAALDAERAALEHGIVSKIEADRARNAPNPLSTIDQLSRLRRLLGEPPRVTWQRLTPPAPAGPSTGSGARAANDQPIGEDRLNFTHYVEAFANLVDSPHTTPPLTIGIYGAWGSGKSFLLGKLTQVLVDRAEAHHLTRGDRLRRWARARWRDARGLPPESPAGPARVVCVPFNAWTYNAAEQIWPRLVRGVLDSVERQIRWHRTPLRWWRKTWRKINRSFVTRGGWKSILALAVVCGVLGWVLARVPAARRWDVLNALADSKLAPETVTLPALAAALGAVVKLVFDTLVTPLGGWVTALFDDGAGYGGDSDLVRDIQRDLGLLNTHLLDADQRVLIVIDDLDRCEPQKTIEVLQSINLLLNHPRFIVCLGIDARVVTAAVEKHYEDLLGPAGVTGYEYLDKIIQIPFRIPDPNGAELMSFVSMQLGDPPPPPAVPRDASGETPRGRVDEYYDDSGTAGRVPDTRPPRTTPTPPARATVAPASDVRPAFRHAELVAFEQVAPLLRPNPRHVKRLVNIYALVRSLAELGGSDPILADPAATVRWLTLCAQWPYAARRMLDHLDAFGAPDAAADPAGAAKPPLRWLLDAVSPSLDAAKQARYDHDARLLERLVASSEGLSWDELRALRAYTVNFNPALDAELRVDDAEGAERRRATRHRPGTGATAYDRRIS
jgi:Cdc6-like AAA superfamily ATPase